MPRRAGLVAAIVLLASACDAAGNDADIAPTVDDGGVVEFGQFRRILEDGEIPGPGTLDDVEFFAEHTTRWPADACDDALCLHGMFGSMGNMISGSECPVLMLGLSTAVDGGERRPLNLAVAIDTSSSMGGANLQHVRTGLERMIDGLGPDDRVTLVTFDDGAQVRAEHAAATDAELLDAVAGLRAAGKTNVYDGLRLAFEAVDRNTGSGARDRVVLLSDGVATAGITSDARIVELASGYGERGVGLSTIGIGDGFDAALLRTLAESGSGELHFLADPRAAEDVFLREIETATLPLAEDLRISVEPGAGYELRAVHGTGLAAMSARDAAIEIPTVHLRHAAASGEDARIGAGAAIITELALTDASGGDDPQLAGALELSYRIPGTTQRVQQQLEVRSPYAPGQTPKEGYFAGGTVEKGFVMLNVMVGFRMASMRASYGDDAGALGVLLSLEEHVAGWLRDNDDADIADDLGYVELFIDNLQARGAEEPSGDLAPEPWPHG